MSLIAPSVPCNDLLNMSAWREYGKSITAIGENAPMMKALAICTQENRDSCVASNHCQNVRMEDSAFSIMSGQNCTECIFSGSDCSKYLPEMLKMPCQIKPLIDTGSITASVIDQVVSGCCGKNDLSQSQFQDIADEINGKHKRNYTLWLIVGGISILILLILLRMMLS